MTKMVRILSAIDDTDNLEIASTGELASMIAAQIETNGWGKTSAITRHQLFLHPDIPYTSHNSSMCFAANLEEQYIAPFIAEAKAILVKESAPGADPGLCVAVIDTLADPGLLIDFGQRAKKYVLTKDEAYDLACKLQVHLSEHGGTGIGVIGALAGVGLRLTGNDGRFQGQVRLPTAADGTASVAEILHETKTELVRSLDGLVLAEDERVYIGDWLKLVLLENRIVLLVCKDGHQSDGQPPRWRVCTKQELKEY